MIDTFIRALRIAILAVAIAAPATAQTAPVADGQKIVMATHSFAAFIGPAPNGQPGPLAALAAERGKTGHEMLAMQFIGGSSPMQQWMAGGNDARNMAKAALFKGGDTVGVFALTPTAVMPDKAIDLWAGFIAAHTPNARILAQASWSGFDGNGAGDFENASRDAETRAHVQDWLAAEKTPGSYLERLCKQLRAIDKRAGHETAYVVPASTAVYTLRTAVIDGRIPGVVNQSQLHRDAIGHPTLVTAHLITYVWYTVIYRECPLGLQAFIDSTDPTSAAREKLLQQIAWNAVVGEPKSGVTGKPVKIGG